MLQLIIMRNLRWHSSRQCLIRRWQQCLRQAEVERQAGQQQDSNRQTPSIAAAGSGGVACSTWVRPGGLPGSSGGKIGAVYQPGSEDIVGANLVVVHRGRAGFKG